MAEPAFSGQSGRLVRSQWMRCGSGGDSCLDQSRKHLPTFFRSQAVECLQQEIRDVAERVRSRLHGGISPDIACDIKAGEPVFPPCRFLRLPEVAPSRPARVLLVPRSNAARLSSRE